MDTDLLYLRDAYHRTFDATVVDAGEDGVVLDRTAFYVTGGGQPHGTGVLRWDGGSARVVDVRKVDGGTHVASTAEVGRVRVVKTESKGKGNKRIRIEVLDG